MAVQKHVPKQIKLSEAEGDALKERLQANSLNDQDIKVILSLIQFNEWMQHRLARAKLTLKKLRQLFGFKNESSTGSKTDQQTGNNDQPVEENDQTGDPSDKLPVTTAGGKPDNKAQPKNAVWDPKENHGRYASDDYAGCPEVIIDFDDEKLKEGLCPHCAEANTIGKLTPENPEVIVLLNSQPLISGHRYCLKKSRCNVCQTYFTANLPPALKDQPKYAPSCATSLSIEHYYAGKPFKRIETLQAAQGVPVADATQYDLVNHCYQMCVAPVLGVLQKKAAEGNSLFFDDTTGRILAQITANKRATLKKDKQGVHATALLSQHQGKMIYLFHTNTLTAGKQFAKLISKRQGQDTFTTMSDTSAHNFPTIEKDLLARWIIALCLTHGRRRFVELLGDADEDARFVLEIIAQVYQHESHCKQQRLAAQDRLAYHQQHSAPVMEALRIWFNNLFKFERLEPNSPLGEAIAYMLKRWEHLTQFLRIPGVALDNNICEQAIKVLIRYRNNSRFYRTFYGAQLGDAMMSVLHTAARNGANLFHYLNSLQIHSNEVNASPENWPPWNYESTIAALTNHPVEFSDSG